jgi:HK97 family phage portal protein
MEPLMGKIFRREKRGLFGTGVLETGMFGITQTLDLVPKRVISMGSHTGPVSDDEAMKNSAVWAAIRIRADLISTLPWRVWRNYTDPATSDQFKLDASPSPLMDGVQFMHFLYASQVELDRSGNAIGIIKEWEPRSQIPTKIDLAASSQVTVYGSGSDIVGYKIGTVEYEPEVIWHEKQYVVAGSPVGMSPVQYAAYTLGGYRSIQEFVAEFFSSGNGPRASLQNTEKTITDTEAALVAESWRASQAMDEPFIHGKNWEYKLIDVQSASNDWIEGQKLGLNDAARFFNVPADLIDAAVTAGSHITYSSSLGRNLQFLVMNLGPAITRREAAFSAMLPRPRQFEFDTDYLMRMDPVTRATWVQTLINSRAITPNEARAVFGRDPMTEDQYEEFFKAGLVHGKASILPGDQQDPNADPAIGNQIESGANNNGNN